VKGHRAAEVVDGLPQAAMLVMHARFGVILRRAVFKALQGGSGPQPVKGGQRHRAIRRDHLPLPVKLIVKGLRDLDGAGKVAG
jgi:hypothetical protein